MTSSARAVALAEAVGGDIKALTEQLLASKDLISELKDALDLANTKIQQLTERLDAMSESPQS